MASAREEIFEKRARHKTREDRYESKKQEKLKTKDGEKITRTKRVKRGDAARAARKAGADLISNFTSKNIGQERLTVRGALLHEILSNFTDDTRCTLHSDSGCSKMVEHPLQ